MEHNECERCRHFEKKETEQPCFDCKGAHKSEILEDRFEPVTKGDLFRAMTDEELAECFVAVTDDVLRGSTWSRDGWLKFLQSESEE